MASPEVWSNKVDFFMSALSYAVGIGAFWRFPFLCYQFGGAAFLIPFILFSLILGLPLVTFELTLGQYGRRGPVGVWEICPLFKGVGWGMLVINLISNTYFVMIIAYGIYYLFASFSSTLPWISCDNAWNTQDCEDAVSLCRHNGKLWINNTCVNSDPFVPTSDLNKFKYLLSVQAGQEYFQYQVLQVTNGIDELGSLRLPLVFCLLGAWGLILLTLSLGVKTWGKVAYVTAIVPFIGLFIILCRMASLPGAAMGVQYYMFPNWGRLLSVDCWAYAAIHVFYSLGLGWGSYITLGRYNRFHSNPLIDSGVIVLANVFGSIFFGFVVFTTVGWLSHVIGVPIGYIMSGGLNLAFEVFPQALSTLSAPNFWCILFFLSLIFLILGSVIPQVANILVTLIELFPALKNRLLRFAALAVIVGVSFLLGLIYTCNGGIHIFYLMDNFAASFALFYVAFLQVLVISWAYASVRLLRDLSVMTGCRQCFCYMSFWNVICPILILLMLIYYAVQWVTFGIGFYSFPLEAMAVGWLLVTGELLVVFLYTFTMLVIAYQDGKLREVVRPTKHWGVEPGDVEPIGVIHPTSQTTGVELSDVEASDVIQPSSETTEV